jgi:hypothetical protein
MWMGDRRMRKTSGQIGIYSLSGFGVRLRWRDGNGGEFNSNPSNGNVPEITIGFDEPDFPHVLRTLLHEAFEFAMSDGNLRYVGSDDWGDSHDGYLFIMTHPQFSDMSGRVGAFLGACLPDTAKAYRSYCKDKNKKGIK